MKIFEKCIKLCLWRINRLTITMTTFFTEVKLMGFANTDNSKSVRSTNSIFAHKKIIGVTIDVLNRTGDCHARYFKLGSQIFNEVL